MASQWGYNSLAPGQSAGWFFARENLYGFLPVLQVTPLSPSFTTGMWSLTSGGYPYVNQLGISTIWSQLSDDLNNLVFHMVVQNNSNNIIEYAFLEADLYSPRPARLAVVNWNNNSVTEYDLPLNGGNVAPSVILAGSNTELNLPFGIASDSVGSLRVGNSGGPISGSITSYANLANGNSAPVSTIAGENTGLTGGVSSVALDSSARIYATGLAASNTEITVYDRGATGDVAPIATIVGTNTELDQPTAIGVDGAGKIYVANYDGPQSSVTVYAPGANGNVAPIAKIAGPGTGILAPQALAVDNASTLYVADLDTLSITVYPPGANGNVAPLRTIGGSNTGLFNPMGIAVDPTGNIYVSNGDVADVVDTICVFGPGANGNVAPQAVITGSLTKLDTPGAMTIVPPGS
jgi:hypothetical protein